MSQKPHVLLVCTGKNESISARHCSLISQYQVGEDWVIAVARESFRTPAAYSSWRAIEGHSTPEQDVEHSQVGD